MIGTGPPALEPAAYDDRVSLSTSSAADRLLAEVDALVGPGPDLAGHPLVRAARDVAAGWVAGAEDVDLHGVGRARVDVAAHAGLLGVTAPVEHGGGGAGPGVARAVTELLAGACGTTWFVCAQHALPTAAVAAAAAQRPDGGAAARWVRPLAEGSALAATAVAHLRRGGAPAVTARRDGAGWCVDGSVGWLTSWGLADVVLLGARAGDDLVLALLPARDAPGLVAGEPLRLAAMQGTRTTTLALDGYRLDAADVVDVVPAQAWLEVDAARTANVVPAVYGLLASLCRALVRAADRPGAEPAADVALRAAERGACLREAAYRLLDEVPSQDQVDERLRLRAESLHLLVATSGALVAACAGGAMSLDHPAQRWAREALFHLVQAQTAPVRTQTLRVFAERLSPPGRAPSPRR